MKKTKKLTVTIGIPAHNEEANIGNLLRSILGQKGNNFTFENIVVVCDGCTDETAAIVKSFGTAGTNFTVVEGKKRLGKMARLNQIYTMNKSDILITLDADLILAEERAVQKIIRAFEDPSVALAVFHQEPVVSDSFVGKICRAADMFWIESRIHVNGGDHAHNLQGSATAMRKIVAQKVKYPSGLNSDVEYLYMKGKSFGAFRYMYDAKAFYRAPDTLHDFWSIASRAIFYRRKSAMKYLGNDLNKIYEIPLTYKVRGLLTVFARSPLYTTLAIILNILVRIFPKKNRSVRSKTWEMAQSARKAIVL